MPRFLNSVVIGNTAAASGPSYPNLTLYDAKLYRNGNGDILGCNQLDQVVNPVQVQDFKQVAPNATLGSGQTGNYAASSFTMPWQGDVTVEIFATLYQNTIGGGAQLVNAYVTSNRSTGFTAPYHYYRDIVNADQVANVVPVMAYHSAVPAGTALTYNLTVVNGGGANSCIVYFFTVKVVCWRRIYPGL